MALSNSRGVPVTPSSLIRQTTAAVVRLSGSARRATVESAGLILVRTIKLTLSRPGSGKWYKRGRKFHRASAPGEPPAADQGILRNSIQSGWISNDVYRVGTNLKYAEGLEYGTPRVLPRPFMRPSVAQAMPALKKLQVNASALHRAGSKQSSPPDSGSSTPRSGPRPDGRKR